MTLAILFLFCMIAWFFFMGIKFRTMWLQLFVSVMVGIEEGWLKYEAGPGSRTAQDQIHAIISTAHQLVTREVLRARKKIKHTPVERAIIREHQRQTQKT